MSSSEKGLSPLVAVTEANIFYTYIHTPRFLYSARKGEKPTHLSKSNMRKITSWTTGKGAGNKTSNGGVQAKKYTERRAVTAVPLRTQRVIKRTSN